MAKTPEPQWPLGKGAGICIHDNALPPKLCRKIIKFFENHAHIVTQGKTMGGVRSDIKDSMDAHIVGSNSLARSAKERETLGKLESDVYRLYGGVLRDYISNYRSLETEWHARQDTGYQYQRYTKGRGRYTSHIDGSPFLGPSGRDRVLASVMYLNTVETGGGTYFDYFDYTCDAVEGRIVTFPATFVHLHGGLVPESSDKSIISTFVISPVPPPDYHEGIDTEP